MSTPQGAQCRLCLGTWTCQCDPEAVALAVLRLDQQEERFALIESDLIARLVKRDEEIAATHVAWHAARMNNGGPIDAEDTVDGVAYVMIRLVDFEAIEAAIQAVTPEDIAETSGPTRPDEH